MACRNQTELKPCTKLCSCSHALGLGSLCVANFDEMKPEVLNVKFHHRRSKLIYNDHALLETYWLNL